MILIPELIELRSYRICTRVQDFIVLTEYFYGNKELKKYFILLALFFLSGEVSFFDFLQKIRAMLWHQERN